MQRAAERLYLNADKTKLVGEGDPKAAFLYAAQGDEIPDSAAEKFGLVEGRLKSRSAKPVKAAETLLGSSVLPSVVVINDTVSVALGAIVMRAQTESGLDVEAWNAQPDEDREARLVKTIEAMKVEAAEKQEAPPTPKPEQRPASKPSKAAAVKKAPAKKA